MADQELINRLTTELQKAEQEEQEAASTVDFLRGELGIAEAQETTDAA